MQLQAGIYAEGLICVDKEKLLGTHVCLLIKPTRLIDHVQPLVSFCDMLARHGNVPAQVVCTVKDFQRLDMSRSWTSGLSTAPARNMPYILLLKQHNTAVRPSPCAAIALVP